MMNRRTALAGITASMTASLTSAKGLLPDVVRIILPLPGGSIDGPTRLFADAWQRINGGACVVDLKPGAAGVIGTTEVVNGRPDGSTLLWTTGATHLTSNVLMKKPPYHPIRDLTPVSMVYETTGFALLQRPAGFSRIGDLIAAAKQAPGKFSYASLGVGHATHVMGALFAKAAGIELLHVPYKGSMMPDLMSGVVDLAFASPSTVFPHIEAKRIHALAISDAQRASIIPQVPTFAELGLNDVSLPSWVGLFAPAKMAPDVLAAVYDAVTKAIVDARFNELLKTFGNKVSGMPPATFKTRVESEFAHLQKALPPLGIEMI